MTINVTFEDFEEMKEFATKLTTAALHGNTLPVVKKTAAKKTSPAKEEPVEEKEQSAKEEEGTEPEETGSEALVSEQGEVTYTLADIRARLVDLQKAGKRSQVQSLIQSYGVDKLTQIPEDKFAEVMEKAGEI